MVSSILSIIGTLLLFIVGLYKNRQIVKEYRKKQLEEAKKDIENAMANNDPSSFLDAFSKL
jgi:cell division protein FtsL